GVQVSLASASNPIEALVSLVPDGFAVPFLITAVVNVITSNVLNSYSSGLTLQACGVKLRRPTAVILDGALSLCDALYVVLVPHPESTLSSFLSLEVIWIASWSAIYLVDAWYRLQLTKQGYSAVELFRWSTGRYWYHQGSNWAAVACWLAGSAGAFLFTNS